MQYKKTHEWISVNILVTVVIEFVSLSNKQKMLITEKTEL